MVMPSLDLFDGSCGSADTLTSPTPSSATTDNTTFFSDEELAQIEDLDLASMMTPIVKAELKFSIVKRLEKTGKDVPQVDMDIPATYPLTSEDEERRQMRRIRNKEAAQKCRGKKRERTDQLEKTVEKLQDRQEDLNSEIEKLKHELEVLQDVLDAHAPFCTRDGCDQSEVQFYLNNDHTYTLVEVKAGEDSYVPSLSDIEIG